MYDNIFHRQVINQYRVSHLPGEGGKMRDPGNKVVQETWETRRVECIEKVY